MPDQSSQAFMAAQESAAAKATRAFPDQKEQPPRCYDQCVEAGYKSPNDKVANISDANQYD